MNTDQKQFASFGIGFSLIMILFPPWLTVHTGPVSSASGQQGLTISILIRPVETATDYSWIFSPPGQSARLDLARLSLQILAMALLFGWCVYLARGQQTVPEQVPSPPRT